jgi:hypothetical protein
VGRQLVKAISNVFSNIVDRLELRELEVVMFLPFLPIIAAIDLYRAIYIPFAVVLIMRMIKVRKKEMTIVEALVGLCIYTIILPDNYTVAVFVAILFIIFLRRYTVNKDYLKLKSWIKKHSKLVALGTVYLLLNIILNGVKVQNIFFEIVYYSVFVALLIIYNHGSFSYTKEISRTINAIVFIEFIYIILFIPLKFYMIKAELIGDWSVGTLGISEGTTLFILYAFALIKYLHQYFKTKDLYFIAFAIICFFGLLTAVNVSLTLFFIISIVLYSLGFLKGVKTKITVLIAAVLMMTIFWNVSDPWIKNGIVRTFTDSEYREERVKKIKTYRDTFITIPMKDIKFLLIGNGMGNYSSRAALTVTGYYVPWFSNNNFIRVSEYTSQYIRPEIYAQYGVSQTDTPSSQYITVMGEFGIIGFALFLFCFFRILYKENSINRLSIIFFLCILFIDNYLEFYKIVLIFYSIYYYIKSSYLISS